MGERKVLNKYFPPDFDPSKVPRGKRVRSEDKQMKVRMMLPMSVRCNTCGTFMYKGTKFNTRMEDVRGEDYLGIKIFRFYYHCTNCAAEFCMKTDPKTADYIVEGGASRNYEPWRDMDAAKESAASAREEEEKGNAMKALENRTLDSKREMDIMTALDEMKSLKARHEAVGTEEALAALRRSAQAEEPVDLDAEDEEAVRRMLLQRAGFVRRLSDSEEEQPGRDGSRGRKGTAAGGSLAAWPTKKKTRPSGPSVAAAAWGEEEQAEAQRGRQAQASGGGGGGEAANMANGGADTGEARESGGNGGLAPEAAAKPRASLGVPAAPAPLPKFGSRPVTVIVKRKQQEAEPLPPHRQRESGGDGGGALLGLAAYGSATDSD